MSIFLFFLSCGAAAIALGFLGSLFKYRLRIRYSSLPLAAIAGLVVDALIPRVASGTNVAALLFGGIIVVGVTWVAGRALGYMTFMIWS